MALGEPGENRPRVPTLAETIWAAYPSLSVIKATDGYSITQPLQGESTRVVPTSAVQETLQEIQPGGIAVLELTQNQAMTFLAGTSRVQVANHEAPYGYNITAGGRIHEVNNESASHEGLAWRLTTVTSAEGKQEQALLLGNFSSRPVEVTHFEDRKIGYEITAQHLENGMHTVTANHKGKRDSSQDRNRIIAVPSHNALVIAEVDGMGGGGGDGERAAEEGVHVLTSQAAAYLQNDALPADAVLDAVLDTQKHLVEIADPKYYDSMLPQSGFVFALAAIANSQLDLIHMGDIHTYLVTHSVEPAGRYIQSLGMDHRQSRHVVTRSLQGIRKYTRQQLFEGMKAEYSNGKDEFMIHQQLPPEYTLLMCSDGLHESVNATNPLGSRQDSIHSVLANDKYSPIVATHRLIMDAYNNGSEDNISTVLVRNYPYAA